MQGYILGQKVFIAVTNINEFKELVETANRQARELQKTIQEINGFDLEIEFNFGNKKPAD